jgi:hypothetical protein
MTSTYDDPRDLAMDMAIDKAWDEHKESEGFFKEQVKW